MTLQRGGHGCGVACPMMAVLVDLLADGVPVGAAVGEGGRRLVVIGVVDSLGPVDAEGDLLEVVVLRGGVTALGAS